MNFTQTKIAAAVLSLSLGSSMTATAQEVEESVTPIDPEMLTEALEAWFRESGDSSSDANDNDADEEIDIREILANRFGSGRPEGSGTFAFGGGRPDGQAGFMFGGGGFPGDIEDMRAEVMDCIANLDVDLPERDGSEMQGRPSRGDFFARLDTNEDGAIDLDEATSVVVARVTERFEQLDANDDGLVDADEVAQAQQARQEQREAIMACVMDQAVLDEG